jgi:hypothetical protein
MKVIATGISYYDLVVKCEVNAYMKCSVTLALSWDGS